MLAPRKVHKSVDFAIQLNNRFHTVKIKSEQKNKRKITNDEKFEKSKNGWIVVN